MGKLIIDGFQDLRWTNGTAFYRIIGTIKDYDKEKAVIRLVSLFDLSKCNIELDFEEHKQQDLILHKGIVVDAEVVTFSANNEGPYLKVRYIKPIDLPGSIVKDYNTLKNFASMKSLD